MSKYHQIPGYFYVFKKYNMLKKYSRFQNISFLFILVIYSAYMYRFYDNFPHVYPILLLMLPVAFGGCMFFAFVSDFFKQVKKKDRLVFLQSIFPIKIEWVHRDGEVGIIWIYLAFFSSWVIWCIEIWKGRVEIDFIIKFVSLILLFMVTLLFFIFLMNVFFLCLKLITPKE